MIRAGSASSVTRKSTFCQPIDGRSTSNNFRISSQSQMSPRRRPKGCITERAKTSHKEQLDETPKFASMRSRNNNLHQRSLSNLLHQGFSVSSSSKTLMTAPSFPKVEDVMRAPENGSDLL